MIKNIVFDFGNVLYGYAPERMTAKHIDNEEDIKLVSSVVYDTQYWKLLDAGELDADGAKKLFKTRLPKRLHRKSDEVYNAWVDDLVPFPKMHALVKKIKEKYGLKLYLLSNMSMFFVNRKDEFEIFDNFDGLVFSAVCKKVKPNFEIYQYLCDKFNLNKEETFFIDDNRENVESANKFGITSYLYDFDSDRLDEYLTKLLDSQK